MAEFFSAMLIPPVWRFDAQTAVLDFRLHDTRRKCVQDCSGENNSMRQLRAGARAAASVARRVCGGGLSVFCNQLIECFGQRDCAADHARTVALQPQGVAGMRTAGDHEVDVFRP